MTLIPEPPEYAAQLPRPDRRRRGGSGRGGRAGRGGRREEIVVPEAEFSSYYGRNIVKPAPWGHEIPAYLYLGGLAAGSGLLSAGGLMSGRRDLHRNARLVALGALGGSTYCLIKDLGKPARFVNMLRTMKLTSPMSVGSWILAGFGTFTGAAATADVLQEWLPKDSPLQPMLKFVDDAASHGAGAFSAPLAAYTAVLLSDTATPTWHEAYRELPFVFVGSALAAAGGAAMVTTGTEQTAPARRMAVIGTVLELAATTLMERRLGILAEPLHEGEAHRLLTAAKTAMIGGAAVTALAGRWRPAAVVAGLALNAGSALTRFGVFEAGIVSAKDPKYTVVPQRQRVAARRAQAAGLASGDGPAPIATTVAAPITTTVADPTAAPVAVPTTGAAPAPAVRKDTP